MGSSSDPASAFNQENELSDRGTAIVAGLAQAGKDVGGSALGSESGTFDPVAGGSELALGNAGELSAGLEQGPRGPPPGNAGLRDYEGFSARAGRSRNSKDLDAVV